MVLHILRFIEIELETEGIRAFSVLLKANIIQNQTFLWYRYCGRNTLCRGSKNDHNHGYWRRKQQSLGT